MTKIYACLLGDWVCLNDDPGCKIGRDHSSPSIWWEENAVLWAPIQRKEPDTLYEFPYIELLYLGHSYRISPYHIQIVDF